MNILLTNQCNRRCKYCFAQERVAVQGGATPVSAAPDAISRANFALAVRMARDAGRSRVGILGGEPSMHPHFVGLLQLAWEIGVDTTVFTNGLWRDEQIERLGQLDENGRRRLHVVLNVNAPEDTPDTQRVAQESFLSRFGSRTVLSYNVYRPDFDSEFLVKMIQQYGLRKRIRIGLAQPLAKGENAHVPVDRYREVVPALMELARACDVADVVLGFDCGFTLCMFEPQELGELVTAGADFKTTCGTTIDVGTDLSVWACFPLSTFTRGVSLADFAGLRAVERHFEEQFGRLYRTGAMDECLDCRHRRRKQCSGGCAAHVFRRLGS